MSEFVLTDEKICFGDLEIFLAQNNNENDYVTRDDALYMFKHAAYVKSYEEIRKIFDERRANDILEIGTYRGGGAAFLHRLFDARRLVCIDVVPGPIVPLERYRAENAEVISCYYGVDQSNRSLMSAIMEKEFPNGIDLVVDDASHFYEETKIAFETVFPYLRPGGIYVIEDWNWAHTEMAQLANYHLADKLALTNLIFELIMLHGAGSILDSVVFAPGMMWVRRGGQPLPEGDFRLDDHTPRRTRVLNRI